MATKFFDNRIICSAEQAVDLLGNILESSIEYSIIGNDLDGKILLWNEGARRLYGYEPEEVVGKANSSILHAPEDDQAGKQRAIMEAALREGKWEGTILRARKNGQRFTARVVITPRRDSAGKAIGYLYISKNISEEIRLAEEVKSTQFYTRSLIESNIDALMTTDPLGIITDVNHQMELLTDCTREELIGSPFKRYFTDPEHAENGIRLVLQEGQVTNYELTARAKGGRETFVSYNASTFRDVAGRLQGVLAAARDVTERKHFEQTLQEKNKEMENANLAKDRFLASMSHELRTPLNAIIGFTGTMLMELPGPLNGEQKKQLQTVKASARHQLSLINDLLDLVKIESGNVKLNPTPVSCNEVINEVAQTLRPLAENKGLRFETRVPGHDIIVQADKRAMLQILINLTNNAIKFTETGKVCIELRTNDGRTEIVVTDTGIGMRTDDQAKLFEPFTRFDDSGSRRQEGTGLGLYLSHKLIDLLGGNISVESEPGKGSEFTIALGQGGPYPTVSPSH